MTFLAVFGTGLLASLSPCVYPLIPITVGYFGTQSREQKSTNILIYALGQILAFMLIGAFAVWAGETFGFSSESKQLNIGIGIFLILSGAWSFYGKLPEFLMRVPFLNGSMGAVGKTKGPIGAFLLGAGSALVASPCTSPILAGVLALMASSGTLAKGLFLMFFYSLGFTFLFLVLGVGLLNLKKLPKSGVWLAHLHRLSSVLLILAGVYYIFRAVR